MQGKKFEEVKVTLDETLEEPEIPGVYDLSFATYGTIMMLEFALVFKDLYERENQEENPKQDLAVCIQVLLQHSESAKRAAID